MSVPQNIVNRIERLERKHALGERPWPRRALALVVEDHRQAKAEIERFCAEHGVSDEDLLCVRVIVPFEQRPGETAREAYEREMREIATRELRDGLNPSKGA
jgi:hypothetical protein